MTYAVAILNYNGLILLRKFIPNVVKNCPNCVIYLIDNNSSDSSVDYINKNYPEIKIIKLIKNYGYAKGYNKAVGYIDEDVIIFLNNDAVFLDSDSFNTIKKTFEANKMISIAQPRILDYNNQDKYEYAGASGGYLDFLGYPFCRGRIINNVEKNDKYNTTREIFWASGSCFIIRKNIFKMLNGFDEDFFCHMEEIDLCWRLKNLNPNYKIITIGKSNVFHIGGGTMQYGENKKNYLNFRNSLVMLIKNLPRKYFISSLFLRFCSDLFILILSLLTFRLGLSINIISAYYFNLLNFRKSLLKRKKQLTSYKYFICFSILINYYFLGKKTFSSIK